MSRPEQDVKRLEVTSVEEGHDVFHVLAAHSDVIKHTMTAVVKLADIGQPTAECQMTWSSRSALVTW